MTIGQRIAQLRRERGMSQEELGEAMGVSRQAISKWESDAALPEVEKLIALSRLFAIPVGQLLGVEEPARGGDPDQADTLSGDQEAQERRAADLAEEVLRRYVEAQYSPPVKPQKRRWKVWAAGAAAVVIAAVCVGQIVDSFQNQIVDLRRQLNDINRSQIDVNNQVSSITSQVEEALASPASRLVNYEMSMEKLDLKGGTARIRVQITPKSIRESESMEFVASDGKTSWRAELLPAQDELSLTAELTLPLADGIRYYVAFQGEAGQETEELTQSGEFSYLAENTSLRIENESGGGWFYSDTSQSVIFQDYEVRIYHFSKMLWVEEDPPRLEQCSLLIYRDDTLRETLPLEPEWKEEDSSLYSLSLEGKVVPCGRDQSIRLVAVGEDSYGRSTALELITCFPDGREIPLNEVLDDVG